MQYIADRYSGYRDAKNYVVGRFNNMYATFMVTADLVELRMLWSGASGTEKTKEGFFKTVQSGLEIELDIMEERFRQRDKATQVLRVFKEALESNLVSSSPA